MGIRAEQKEKRRQDILDTSLDLFIHKGFSATSVRDIAGRLKISPALLFHYFESKDDILVELLAIALGGVQMASKMLEDKSTPLKTFEMIAQVILGSFTSYPLSAPLFLLVHQVSVYDSMPDKAKELVSRASAVDATIPLILEGQAKNEIRAGDPFALSLAYWSAIQGIAEIVAITPGCPVPEGEWIAAILKK